LEYSQERLKKNTFFFYRNTGELFKHVSPDAFSPYCLLTYEKAKKSKDFEFFLSQKIAFIIDNSKKADETDSIHVIYNKNITFKEFTPSRIEIEIDSAKAGNKLVLLQNVYPYWKAYVNGIKSKIDTVGHTFIGISLMEGKNNIILLFNPKKIKIAFLISLGAWIFVILFLFVKYIHENKRKTEIYFIFSFVFLSFLLILRHLFSYHLEQKGINFFKIQKFTNDSTYFIINAGNNFERFEKQATRYAIKKIPLYLKGQLGELQKILSTIDKKYLCYIHINMPYYYEEEEILKFYYPLEIRKINYGRNFVLILQKDKTCSVVNNNPVFYTQFENVNLNTKLDSTESFSGKYSNYIDSINRYSFTYENTIKELNLKKAKYLKVELKFKRKSINSDPLAIVEILRNGKTFYYQWIPLKWFEAEYNQWNFASIFFPLVEFLKDDDIIKVYISAFPDDDRVYIDDFKIERIR